MMKSIKKYARGLVKFLVMGLVLGGGYAFVNQTLVQELKQELGKAYAFYQEQEVLYMHSTVYGVPVKNANGQVKIGTAELYRDGYDFYTKALGREMYCKGKRALLIQHHKKTVTLYEHFDAKRMMKEQVMPLDSLLKRVNGKDSLVRLEGKTGHYRLFSQGKSQVYTDMVFDQKDHFLKEYHYTVYTEGADLRSDYSKIKVHYDQVSKKLPVKMDFDLGRFLDGSGKNMKVNQQLLKGYKLRVKQYYYGSERWK